MTGDWLRQTAATLRAAWRPLLAVGVVVELVGVLAVLPLYFYLDAVDVDWDETAQAVFGYALPAVAIGVLGAWTWAAMIVVLREAGAGRPARVGAALLEGARRCGRLALWLTGIALVFAAMRWWWLQMLLDSRYAVAHDSWFPTVVTTASWYVDFGTALLPLVLLAGHGGLARAWRLAHNRLRTALQIGVVLAFGWAVTEAVGSLTEPWVTGPGSVYGSGGRVAQIAALSLASVAVSVVTTAALATAYAQRLPQPDAEPEPEVAPAEPGLIDLGMR